MSGPDSIPPTTDDSLRCDGRERADDEEESCLVTRRSLVALRSRVGLRRVRVGAVGQSAHAPAGWHILPSAIGLDAVGRQRDKGRMSTVTTSRLHRRHPIVGSDTHDVHVPPRHRGPARAEGEVSRVQRARSCLTFALSRRRSGRLSTVIGHGTLRMTLGARLCNSYKRRCCIKQAASLTLGRYFTRDGGSRFRDRW